VLISGLELKVYFLVCLRSLRINYVIVESNRLIFIDTSDIPLVGASVAYFSI
jgi:hypothetical protein